MEKSELKISVALCTYNASEIIIHQLNTILTQTYPVDEIVICDDHSTDHTIEVISNYLHKQKVKFKIFQNDQRLGKNDVFEKCLMLCSGDVIFMSTQKDPWRVDKVEKFMAEMIDPQVQCVMCDADMLDENGQLTGHKLSEICRTYTAKNSLEVFHHLLKGFHAYGGTMAYKKELIEQATPFSPYWTYDEWLLFHAVLQGFVEIISLPLVKFQVDDRFMREESMTPAKRREKSFNHYLDAYNSVKCSLSNACIVELKGCVNFWEKLYMDADKSTMTRLFIQGKYHRYTSGFTSYLQDLLGDK